MKTPLDFYLVDAFADKPFSGNPAAIYPMDEWLPDDIMQKVAVEHNLSETAFIVPEKEGYRIRWFTPAHEVDLCGHATLAAAFVIWEQLGYEEQEVIFYSKSGELPVTRSKGWYTLNFPLNDIYEEVTPSSQLIVGLKHNVKNVYKGMDTIVLMESEEDILSVKPDFEVLGKLDTRGVVITAPSENYDFVSRFFAPKHGINEDPVTGSAYTLLAPFWKQKLKKNELFTKQLSSRGGEVKLKIKGDRVFISGEAVLYAKGSIVNI